MRKSPEVVVAGHICLDIIPQIASRASGLATMLAPGKLIEVGSAATVTGGAVSNTGIALHRLGIATRLAGKVGDDLFGQVVLDVLRSIDAELAEGMIVSPAERTSYTIVISPPGIDRMFLHYTGTNDTFAADDVESVILDGAKLFHFGYPPMMRRMYAGGGAELALLMGRAKAAGLTTSLDMAMPDPDSKAGRTDWPSLLAKVLPKVDVFLPSFEELLFMLDRALYDALEQRYGSDGMHRGADGELLSALAARLLGMGSAVAAIKLGEQGLYVRTAADPDRLRAMGALAPARPEQWAGRERLVPCFSVEAQGTTGAGDCTIAGFIGGMLRRLSLEEALVSAVAVGACCVERTDATSGIPAWDTVQRRIVEGWPRRPTTLPLDEQWVWDDASSMYSGPYKKLEEA